MAEKKFSRYVNQPGSGNPKKINDPTEKPHISSAAETLRNSAATRKT
jgi:hypothetical protein